MQKRSGTGGAAKVRGRKTTKLKRRKPASEVARRSPSDAILEADFARVSRELNEARDEQTATSEVLQVISRFPGDVQPVFAALLEKAVRICGATFGNIFRYDGNALRLIATHNTPPAFAEARKGSPLSPSPNGPFDRMLKTKKVVHVADVAAEKNYTEQRHPTIVEAIELGGGSRCYGAMAVAVASTPAAAHRRSVLQNWPQRRVPVGRLSPGGAFPLVRRGDAAMAVAIRRAACLRHFPTPAVLGGFGRLSVLPQAEWGLAAEH
jgi:hypothetical protein